MGVIRFEQFTGLNTKPPRPSIRPTDCSWLDGAMPVTDTSIRVLPAEGDSIYTAPDGLTITFFAQFNIADTDYFFILLSDGSAQQVNIVTGGVTTITGTNSLLATTGMGTTSWGGQYFIFTQPITNGYFIWDGSNLYKSGTIGPIVTITDGGLNYTGTPSVTLVGGSGSGAMFSTQIENGTVSQVLVTNPGSSYVLGDIPIVIFSGGNGTATAWGQAVISNGVITNVTLLNGGSGYQNSSTGVQQPPTISVSDPTGSGAVISVNQMAGGQLISLKVVSGGTGYTSPTINFSGSGSGASAVATVDSGVITSYSTDSNGLGYTGGTTIDFLSATGTGATATATLNPDGSVAALTITAGGSGYSSPTNYVVRGAGPAAATVTLMPFGISGTSLETFQSRVWIANGQAVSNDPPKNRIIFSASDDPANFDPSQGAGAFPSTDSFLRVGYHSLKQVNGFLYLIGDSSVNTIAGVQSSTPSGSTEVITTFNNQNADPQLGTPWPASVQVFSRNIVFANTIGVMVSYGGAVTKISDPLDGFYSSALNFGSTANYPSAVATIFGNTTYMLLIPIVDPIRGQTLTKLIMWDGRRFFTSPATTTTFIATQELNSILTAWGTRGTDLFPLFVTPSDFPKVIQTKLFADSTYLITKTALHISGIIQDNSNDGVTTITIDNEVNSSISYTIPSSVGGLTWSGLTWSGLTWGGAGLNIFGPIPVGQSGRLLGMTLTTTASDIELLSLNLVTQNYIPNF